MARKKAWEGRLEGKLDPVFEAFNLSLKVDRVLLPDDLVQNRAWARALASAGVYSESELTRVQRSLDKIEKEAGRGEFPFVETAGDVQMGVGRRRTGLGGGVRTAGTPVRS